MDSIKVIQYIRQYINEIEELKTEKDESSIKFQEWQEKTETLIKHVFGESSTEYKDLKSLFHLFHGFIPDFSHPNRNTQNRYINRLDDIRNKLIGYIDVIKLEYDADSERIFKDSNALEEVIRICERFHNVARHISGRYSQRPPFQVHDEYDVQYLLEILLAVSFDDIRSEEPSPSFAGTTSRIDFLLKDEGIAIETKMTRKGLADKELTKQLIQDIAQYQIHPNVTTLVCFIYDPDRHIINPFGLINDLESKSDKLKIKVVISPL